MAEGHEALDQGPTADPSRIFTLILLTIAMWWELNMAPTRQDDGAAAARRAQDATGAANIGPTLHRIVADGETNLTLEETRNDWAETLARQREIARRVY
ncbi:MULTISPECIES: hypothetical protein [unclassified Xanthobacter]|uniref:hypothetical protein n=1 Tax=unclassified Xanthobacter TaxID=2623496 RepID=UPI001F28ECAF|nr:MULTISPECIES: hypothetical protein [unclassified Xanthobacter]